MYFIVRNVKLKNGTGQTKRRRPIDILKKRCTKGKEIAKEEFGS